MTGQRTVPSLFVAQQFVGGHQDTVRKHASGELQDLLSRTGWKDKTQSKM